MDMERQTQRSAMRAWLALPLWCAAATAWAAPDWDIVGIRLGMTPAQARAAMQAYAPKAQILETRASLNYSDKLKAYRTEPFLTTMEVRDKARRNIPLKVWFSGPRGEARVIAVHREELNIPNPPSGSQFLASLTQKYGEPTATNPDPAWEESGKPRCLRTSWGTDYGSLFAVTRVVTGDFAKAAADIERRPAGAGMPADRTTCGAFMVYTGTKNNPARFFVGAMFDVGAIVATHRDREGWVKQLEADAVKKREAGGQVPRL